MSDVEDKPHRTYAKISFAVTFALCQKRQQLVDMVVHEERSISKIARRLGIKLSTAKLIIRNYKTDGRLFESKADRAVRLAKEQQKTATVLVTPETVPVEPVPSQDVVAAPPTGTGNFFSPYIQGCAFSSLSP